MIIIETKKGSGLVRKVDGVVKSYLANNSLYSGLKIKTSIDKWTIEIPSENEDLVIKIERLLVKKMENGKERPRVIFNKTSPGNQSPRTESESITTRSTAFERTKVSAISNACSPVSGWETKRSSSFTPRVLA